LRGLSKLVERVAIEDGREEVMSSRFAEDIEVKRWRQPLIYPPAAQAAASVQPHRSYPKMNVNRRYYQAQIYDSEAESKAGSWLLIRPRGFTWFRIVPCTRIGLLSRCENRYDLPLFGLSI